ncbi:hypothetical protein [uncultured Maribacter sp.]|uniref:hypothetical protein n=1 Tax=uncultured Maribacter sp. TaxID=431308 RepID=UPI00262DDD30|nr:hypothetical protein [uncultured Maribacter sp.]
MKKKKKDYDNGTKYNFVSNIGDKLGETLVTLNSVVFGIIELKPYNLEWNKILKEFNTYKNIYGEVNIDTFAYDYVLGYSLINKFSTNKAIKEAMYLHLRAELNAKIANGVLEN